MTAIDIIGLIVFLTGFALAWFKGEAFLHLSLPVRLAIGVSYVVTGFAWIVVKHMGY